MEASLALAAASLGYVLLKSKKPSKGNGKEMEGPGVPVLGDLPTATWWAINNPKKLPMHRTLELHEQYGPVYKFGVGTATFVMVADPVLAKNILTGEHFQEHINLPFLKEFGAKKGMFLADTKRWKMHRKFSQIVLKDMGLGSMSLCDNILAEGDCLTSSLSAANGQPQSTKYTLSKSVSNVINVLVFGKRFGYEDPDFIKYLDHTREVVQVSLTLVFLPMMMPKCAHIPEIMSRIPGSAGFVKSYAAVKEFCMSEVKRQKANLRDENGNYTEAYYEKDNFITSFIKEQFKREDNGDEEHVFTDEDLADTVSDMFIAGTDTTATAVSWGLLYLAIHQDVQEKLYQEVKDIKDQILELKSHLHYTRAVLDEILRMGCVIPMIMRENTQDTFIGDFAVDKGTTCAVNNFAISRNPEIFPEPETFNPDRHLSEEGEYAPAFPVDTLVFGMGKRSCIGSSLALMEYMVFIVKTVQKFYIILPEEERATLADTLIGLDGAAHVPKDHKLIFSERNGDC